MLGLDRIQHENRHTEAGFFDCPDSGTGLRPERETGRLPGQSSE
jgi:hypothetical protein